MRRAREIMGKKNFFGIPEAIGCFKLSPSHQQLIALAQIPFSERTLEELKNTHVLIAVFPFSINEIHHKYPKLFFDQSWYYNKESFAKEHGEASWQLVRKTPVPDSTSKNWQEQQVLIGKDDEVSVSARVMVYTIIGHYLATGERLFEHVYVRTSSMDTDGYRVVVGYFDSDGLRVPDYWVGVRSVSLGVSSARKF